MENNIGVGILIGIATASSLYVWKAHSFTKTQKTFLLLFVLFPPAQWLSILIVSLYNNYKINNTSEKKQERKIEELKNELDNSISNLENLKNKGILTDEEYKIKVDKINAEKEKQSIKNSEEYKQLKSLFDSGILTKEEFESKIGVLKNKTNNSDILPITVDNIIGTYETNNIKFIFSAENKIIIYKFNFKTTDSKFEMTSNQITFDDDLAKEIITIMFLSHKSINLKYKNKIYKCTKSKNN